MAVNRVPDPAGGIQPSTLTTTGDILFASSAQVAARLGIGSTNQVLGVTSGVPAYQASSKSTLTTTGDILYASAANTPARLGIGTTGQNLVVASGIPSWATPSSGGKVLQVVSMNYTTEVGYSNSTATATGITLAITPSAVSSKVLIFFSVNGVTHTSQNTLNGATIKLYRDASSIVQISAAGGRIGGTPVDLFEINYHHTYLDSPATTSATTYTVYVNNYYNGNALYINNAQTGTDSSSITLLEIGA